MKIKEEYLAYTIIAGVVLLFTCTFYFILNFDKSDRYVCVNQCYTAQWKDPPRLIKKVKIHD